MLFPLLMLSVSVRLGLAMLMYSSKSHWFYIVKVDFHSWGFIDTTGQLYFFKLLRNLVPPIRHKFFSVIESNYRRAFTASPWRRDMSLPLTFYWLEQISWPYLMAMCWVGGIVHLCTKSFHHLCLLKHYLPF